MNAGLIPLAIAMVGLAYAALVLRGAPRRDNLVFGLLTLTDAANAAWRGMNVLTGGSIISRGVLVPCTIGTIVLAMLTLEFIAGFPRGRAMSWRWRIPMLAWGVSALAFATIESQGPWGPNTHLETYFFAPITLVIFIAGWFAYRRTTQRDARIVIGVLWFRWAFGFGAYFLGPLLGIFEAAVWAETTVATTVSFVVIGTAVLRSELFSLRSAAAEVVTLATIALLVMLGTGAAIAATLTYLEPGRIQYLALFGSALVPLALTAIGFVMYPRVERAEDI